MIRINLLSEGRRPVVARRTRSSLNLGGQDPSAYLLVGGLVLGLLAGGIYGFMLNSEIKDKDRRIGIAQREYEELRTYIEEVEKYEVQKAELKRKVEVIGDLRNKQRGPVQVMDEVSRALPELVWLEYMDITGNTVTLRGRAFNTNAVATFLENLSRVAEFKEPALRDLPADRATDTYSFKLLFNYAFKYATPIEDEDEDADADSDSRL